MGRIVVVNFTSIDGVIQSPLSADEDADGGFSRGGWVPPYVDEVVTAFMRDATVSAAGLLLGGRSYRTLADAWSGADEGEDAVAAMNRMPKHVVTRAPVGRLDWNNSHRVEAGLPGGVEALVRRTPGNLVVFGSGELVRGLARHDLVDEYRLLVFPVLLGAGKRMFDDRTAPRGFDLAGLERSSTGVSMITFRRD